MKNTNINVNDMISDIELPMSLEEQIENHTGDKNYMTMSCLTAFCHYTVHC